MKTKMMLTVAALSIALVSGIAEAGKGGKSGGGGGGGKGGGGGGVSTNYGCTYLRIGTVITSPDQLSTATISTSEWTCYICNLTTRVCAIQSPSPYAGWTFIMP